MAFQARDAWCGSGAETPHIKATFIERGKRRRFSLRPASALALVLGRLVFPAAGCQSIATERVWDMQAEYCRIALDPIAWVSTVIP
jgi:hypothetical protein